MMKLLPTENKDHREGVLFASSMAGYRTLRIVILVSAFNVLRIITLNSTNKVIPCSMYAQKQI
jgi:hypothetical protein